MSVDVCKDSTTDAARFQTRPHPAACKVSRARDACSEALAELSLLEGKLSGDPGLRGLSCTWQYWTGLLQGLTAYLLVTLEEQDASR